MRFAHLAENARACEHCGKRTHRVYESLTAFVTQIRACSLEHAVRARWTRRQKEETNDKLA